MIKASRKQDQVTIARVHEHGQNHVFRFWEELDSAGKRRLLDQIEEIDFQLLGRLVQKVNEAEPRPTWSSVEPAPVIPLPRTPEELADRDAARAAGEEALAAGKVAALMVAGGQASRLGYDGPKGTFPVGSISKKSLYQLHTEKVRATSRRYKQNVPLLVMTSESTHAATVDFYERNEYFGLNKLDVRLFQQRMVPAVDKRGKLILEGKDRVFTNPNGHGGTFQALAESGALDALRERGVEQLFYFQVDNPLVALCDPVFVGHHIRQGADFSAKAVLKTDPEEKVGVFALLDGALGVLEYSDLPQDLKQAQDNQGRLRFSAGSIAIHIISVDFADRVRELGFPLPFHRALKAIPYCDRRGNVVTPKEPNGIKFETFLFDAFQFARRAVVLEVERREEFSPVKNAVGVDSAETARRDMIAQGIRWLETAGLLQNGQPRPAVVEISPLRALDPEELARRAPKDLDLSKPEVYVT